MNRQNLKSAVEKELPKEFQLKNLKSIRLKYEVPDNDLNLVDKHCEVSYNYKKNKLSVYSPGKVIYRSQSRDKFQKFIEKNKSTLSKSRVQNHAENNKKPIHRLKLKQSCLVSQKSSQSKSIKKEICDQLINNKLSLLEKDPNPQSTTAFDYNAVCTEPVGNPAKLIKLRNPFNKKNSSQKESSLKQSKQSQNKQLIPEIKQKTNSKIELINLGNEVKNPINQPQSFDLSKIINSKLLQKLQENSKQFEKHIKISTYDSKNFKQDPEYIVFYQTGNPKLILSNIIGFDHTQQKYEPKLPKENESILNKLKGQITGNLIPSQKIIKNEGIQVKDYQATPKKEDITFVQDRNYLKTTPSTFRSTNFKAESTAQTKINMNTPQRMRTQEKYKKYNSSNSQDSSQMSLQKLQKVSSKIMFESSKKSQ